jgi:6-phosphogluconate dehydrogenase
MIMTFSQGMALLRVASDEYHYDLPLEAVAHVWRGSILRSPMLREIYDAFSLEPRLPNLLSDSQFAHQSWSRHDDLRAVVRLANELGIPAPALTASLTYYDANRQICAQAAPRCEQPDTSIGLPHAKRERDGLPANSLVSHSS